MKLLILLAVLLVAAMIALGTGMVRVDGWSNCQNPPCVPAGPD